MGRLCYSDGPLRVQLWAAPQAPIGRCACSDRPLRMLGSAAPHAPIGRSACSDRPLRMFGSAAWHARIGRSASSDGRLRMAQQVVGRPVRVLDLACGGGDVGLSLAKQARRRNTDVEITGWDVSSVAVSIAADNARAAGIDNICFVEANVLQDKLPTDFDIVMCSLFLHHLTEAEAVTLLRKMAAATRGDVLVNDLQRSRVGYHLARIGCRVLTRSPIVHYDGPISVAGAYTIEEAAQLAASAGLANATVRSYWPERFLLSWSRS